ncbi:MAG: hypothetical protein AB7L66_15615 [Gemmatimonadales bacterium]
MQVTVQVPAPPAPPDIFVASGPPEGVLIAAVLVVGVIVAGVILMPLIKAFARRIEGRSLPPGVTEELDQLRARVAELEGVTHRLAELEERVDFSERLLAQGSRESASRREA